jgi:TRAP-type uncharacterized transport system substrate-binding protein
MSRGSAKYALIVLAAAIAGMMFASAPAGAEQRKLLRWTTGPAGSFGHTIATSIAKTMESALGGEYAVSVSPYPSTTLAMRATMDGYGEIAYTADIGMTEFSQRSGGFNKYKARAPEIAHTWYAFPMESMMAVLSSSAGRFKCWRDLSGQPVYYTSAGFMQWLNWRRVFNTLGYNLRHIQIDLNTNARSLQSGTIVGSAVYTTAGAELADYWVRTMNQVDVTIVNPCADEIEKIRSAGLSVVDVNPKPAFSKNVGPSTLQGVPILFGYNARLDIPEESTYRLISAIYRDRDRLAAVNPAFAPMARDFVGMQVNGINANPEIAVHPGLARFLREHNAWSDKWKVGPS